MKFIFNKQILDAVRELTSKDQLLQIAVAYWGRNAIRISGLEERIKSSPESVEVLCDLLSGACNPVPIQTLRNSNVKVKTCPKLHAKVWTCGSDVIVGSANVSANGFGFDSVALLDGNEEAAVHITDKLFATDVRDWFSNLWVNSDEINDDHITWARKRQKLRKHSVERKRASRQSLLQKIGKGGNLLKFKNVRIMAWRESSVEVSERAIEVAKTDPGGFHEDGDAQGTELWKRSLYSFKPESAWKFDHGTIYLDFTTPPMGKKLSFNGIFRVVSPSNLFERINSSEKIILLRIEDECNGYIFRKEEQKMLTELVSNYLDKTGWNEASDGIFLDECLTKFMREQ